MGIVYRVHESKNLLVGPMHSSSGGFEGANWQLPGPRRDGIDFCSDTDYCACASLNQLLEWFGNCLLTLFRRKFVVSLIEVADTDIKRGIHQVAVRLDKNPTIVKTIKSHTQFMELFRSCSD